ncbi:MAG: hypothetical protein CMJ64_28295 [Planctomycetaceae bacterium]|nr:hypothetical protein [Planctomycetaceae bacterium]
MRSQSGTFLFRLEEAPEGDNAAPVSDWELASRLSYFLWSSMPDEELRATAESSVMTVSSKPSPSVFGICQRSAASSRPSFSRTAETSPKAA